VYCFRVQVIQITYRFPLLVHSFQRFANAMMPSSRKFCTAHCTSTPERNLILTSAAFKGLTHSKFLVVALMNGHFSKRFLDHCKSRRRRDETTGSVSNTDFELSFGKLLYDPLFLWILMKYDGVCTESYGSVQGSVVGFHKRRRIFY
jgi:hypothetical protein